MNIKGQERCMELDEQIRAKDKEELANLLISRRNMAMLCHCSAEIDQSTLLYFSVNNMYLGSGDYIILLFAESSSHSKAQDEGMDVFSRSYTYTLIQEKIISILSGHFTFYPCELDGRLVVLIQFHYGILDVQREGLLNMIKEHCRDVMLACKKEYDLNVNTYISEVFSDIPTLSSIYHKMLSVVTLHQYLNSFPKDNIYIMSHPAATDPGPSNLSFAQNAASLANKLALNENYDELLLEIVESFMITPFMSTDELRIKFGDFFETLMLELRLRGFKINIPTYRTQMISALMNATHWSDIENWLKEFTFSMKTFSENKSRKAALAKYNEAMEYIDTHLDDPLLSVRDIAEEIGLASPALISFFKKNTDLTPAKYIREKRLSKAADMLSSDFKNIHEISDECGFGSVETFHRAFKSKYGISPGQFRNLNQ
ncbi:MAG: AraC family transcriptional regulator [Eubacterium sp.]|nr:AraC family transcriptional regulator [Eubacterium sp.]